VVLLVYNSVKNNTMAYTMRSGNKPQFKSMGSSPARSHNVFHKDPKVGKPTTTGKSEDGIASVDLKQVNVNSAKGFANTNNKLPMYLPGGGDYDPITATATNTNTDKRRSSKEKFNSDVSSFISGIAGIPGEIVGEITGKVSDVGGWVKKGVDKIKANKLARKQDKIDNPKPEKVKNTKKEVKKVKKEKTTDRTKSLQAEYQSEHKDGTKFPNGKTYNAKGKKVVSKETKDNIKKSFKSAKSQIGEQIITQGVSAGIQALLTPKEKQQRDRSNPNLGGFSQMKFGRRPMEE
jgi:hypothetical protein